MEHCTEKADSGDVPPYGLRAGEPTFRDWLRATFWRVSAIGLHLPMLAVTLAVSLIRFGQLR